MNSEFRWSFSQWEAYNACPARWKYKSVMRLPGAPPGPAAARGIEIHATVEEYIAGRSEQVHAAVTSRYIGVFNQFRAIENVAQHQELKVTLAQDWSLQTTPSVRPWVTMILDAARVAVDAPEGQVPVRVAYIGEWKSGKPKPTHADQRILYALGSLVRWPEVERVEVTTYYLEDTAPPELLVVQNTPSAQDKLKALWQGRVDLMQRDTLCAPRPGMYCNWCDYAKRKGGPCVFGG